MLSRARARAPSRETTAPDGSFAAT